MINERVVFIEEKRFGNPEGAGHIAYCAGLKAWTLYLNETTGPCDWVAKSQETETFDVTETGSSNWFVNTGESGHNIQYTSFFLACNDCTTSLCAPDKGTCNNNTCVCKEGHHGVNCEFQDPCITLQVDFRQSNFSEIDAGLYEPPQTYELLYDENNTDFDFSGGYDKAIYVGVGKWGSYDDLFILRFTGRRFVIYHYANSFTDIDDVIVDFIEFGMLDFHGYYSDYSELFISQPLDVGTDEDSYSPEGYRYDKLLQISRKRSFSIE